MGLEIIIILLGLSFCISIAHGSLNNTAMNTTTSNITIYEDFIGTRCPLFYFVVTEVCLDFRNLKTTCKILNRRTQTYVTKEIVYNCGMNFFCQMRYAGVPRTRSNQRAFCVPQEKIIRFAFESTGSTDTFTAVWNKISNPNVNAKCVYDAAIYDRGDANKLTNVDALEIWQPTLSGNYEFLAGEYGGSNVETEPKDAGKYNDQVKIRTFAGRKLTVTIAAFLADHTHDGL